MGLTDDLRAEVQTILDWEFKVREEKERVPSKEDLSFGKTAIEITTGVLYVDMRGSSLLADSHRRTTSAKIYNAYLNAMVRVARYSGGEIRSFNGDSVLAFFDPGLPHLSNVAVRTAMQMQWVAHKILEPSIKAKGYEEHFRIGIGVTTGPLLVTKAGLRGEDENSALIWPCTAVNLAAKLGDAAKDPYGIYISKGVYDNLSPEMRYKYPNAWFFPESLWEEISFSFAGKTVAAYRTPMLCEPK